MAILQHQFVYQGNAAEVPFNKICLNLEVPGFEYTTTSDSDTTSFSRSSNLGNHALKIFQALQSDNYSVDLPNRYLIGNDDKSVINFWKYLQGVPKDLDSLSFQADLLIKHELQVLKPDSIEVIYSLATSANEYKQIVAAERELNQGVSLNPAAVRRVTNEILKYSRENLILINKKVFAKVAEGFRQITSRSDYLLLTIISRLVKVASNKPILIEISQAEIGDFRSKFDLSSDQINNTIELIRASFDDLFDFPIFVPKIVTIEIKGDIKFLSQTNETADKTDLINYDLFVEYTDRDAIQTKTIKYRWDNFTNEPITNNTQIFNFFNNNNRFVLLANQANSVTVTLRLFDNTVLQRQTFDGLDLEGLGNIHFEVDLYKIVQPENSTTPTPDSVDRKLKGKVLELSGKCSLKNLTVIVQAKERETDLIWKVVGSAITSNVGDFVMKYPGGVFAKAQALVSLTPDSPVDIPVFTDTAHVDAKQTISNEFLFLLLKDADCEPKDKTEKGDCECEPDDRIARLPSHEDLINSDKFSQDLGGGSCVNLTTPNRTLSETVHYAIVRTSEPDVANYVLEKEVASDSTNPTDFNKNKTTFRLSDGQKIERQSVDFGNPIRWQDDPANNNSLTIYQAVQVAHGHLLTYKTAWKADGYSLGDMVYSLPLAPGQKKQIVINELKRTLEGSQQQILSQRESLSASIVNDRGIIDNLSGSIRESTRGRSSASTGGVSAGLGLGFIGPVSGILGVSGGFANSRSTASQDNARTVTQSFSEVLRNSITQSANSYRELNGTIIETVSESQQFSTTSEVVANHNHCHALTILYFEVLRHYAVYQELVQVEECIFVPLLMTNFTSENIYQWRDVLAENLLARPSSTYLTTLLGENPLLKAFDANERIKTNYSTVDYPVGAYDDEKISYLKGTLNLRVNFQRPKTKYDRIKSLPIVNRTITSEEFDFATLRKSVMVAAVTGGLSLLFGGANATKTDAEQIKVKAELFDQFMQMDANFETVPPAQCIRVRRFNSLSLNILGVSINISGEDFFENGTNDRTQWETYAGLLGYTGDVNSPAVYKMLDYYFKDRLISEWDDIFYKDILPVVFERILDGIGLENFALDLTPLSKYQGGERVIVVNLYGLTQSKRNELPLAINFTVANNDARILKDFITFIVENANLYYSTPHYNGILFGGYIGADLLDGATISIPESADEKRNPRIEDIFIVNELITHLNSNLEYYNKVLWYSLDPDRKYLLLDGFNIEVFNDLAGGIVNQSLASVVKNELIGIAGNSLIFPVAAGVNLDRRNIIIQQPDVEAGNSNPTQSALDLFEHYKPLTPPPPYRISVPTRGVYAEALQGACNACEKVDPDTAQDWDKFKPDEPTAISPVTVGVPTPTAFNPQFKEFATPIVNIQNAPAAPAPGAGLAGLSELLGKSDIFKDITGLTENQKNAMQTYLSNQENAKAFAEVAKEMTMQGHNTAHADKIQDSINNSNLSDEVKAKLTKDHIQQMIDGGESKKAEIEKEKQSQPSLTGAVVNAAEKGQSVEAENIDITTGKSEKIKIEGKPNPFGFKVKNIPFVSQIPKDNGCWAAAATMMVSWRDNKVTPYSIPAVLAMAGQEYVDKFQNDNLLLASEKEDFITSLNMVGIEPDETEKFTLESYMQMLKKYGPLWITTDSNAGESFSPHARILIGYEEEKGDDTQLLFFDPSLDKTTQPLKEIYKTFFESVKELRMDNPSDTKFIQIVHFANKNDVGEGRASFKQFDHSFFDPTTSTVKKLVPSEMRTSFYNPANLIITSNEMLLDKLSALIESKPLYKSKKNKFAVSIVDLSGSKKDNPEYAGYNDFLNFYAASTAKVTGMIATYQLRFDINHLLSSNPNILDIGALEAKLFEIWKNSGIEKYYYPDIKNSFDFVRGTPSFVTIKQELISRFNDISHGNANGSTAITLNKFNFVGSTMLGLGLYNSKNGGLWVRKTYGNINVRGEPKYLNAKDIKPPFWSNSPFPSSKSHNVNALSMALLYTLCAQGRLIDSSSSQAILDHINKGGCGTNYIRPSTVATLTPGLIAVKCGIFPDHPKSTYVHVPLYFKSSDTDKEIIVNILTKNIYDESPDSSFIQELFDDLLLFF
jgi:Papain-like cysteine protease AvrRpt2